MKKGKGKKYLLTKDTTTYFLTLSLKPNLLIPNIAMHVKHKIFMWDQNKKSIHDIYIPDNLPSLKQRDSDPWQSNLGIRIQTSRSAYQQYG